MPYILTVTIDPPGAGSVLLSPWGDYISPGKISYPAGTVVTMTAIPAIVGAYFDHWEGDASGTATSITITMNSDKAITAVFGVLVPTFQLTTGVVGDGWVAPSEGVFNEGDQIILVAYANEGSVFSSWSGDIAGTAPVPGMPNQLIVVMDQDRHIVAEFELVAPEFAGTISRKELEYDHVSSSIPVY